LTGYKKIIAFRNSSKAIRRGTLTSYSTADVCAFTKQQGDEKVLVIVNLRDKPVKLVLPKAVANSSWKEVMKGGKVALKSRINLKPYSYLILRK